MRSIQIFLLITVLCGVQACRSKNGEEGIPYGSPNYTSYHKENRTRDAWQKPSELISKLGNIEDKTIADIGAGTGYFTFRLALNAKKVIAIDIDTDMIELVEAFKKNLPQSLDEKIESRLATPKDPHLVANEADIVWMVNTISYIEDKPGYLSKQFNLIPVGGVLMIADYKMSKIPFNVEHGDHKISPQGLGALIQSSGFKDVQIDNETLEYQYIITAEKQ